jgi:hypothetical protein
MWDLGFKRTAALRHAKRHGIEKLLMLDEDIEVDPSILHIASKCMNEFQVVSIIPVNTPDRSVFGDHLSEAGIRSTVFLTASCLLIQAVQFISSRMFITKIGFSFPSSRRFPTLSGK